jgi:hypothetical protein
LAATAAASANLHRSIRRDQSIRAASTTRLRHLPNDPLIAPEYMRQSALVARGQGEVQASQ